MAINSIGATGVALQQQLVAAKPQQQDYPDQTQTRSREEASRPNETQAASVQGVQAQAAPAPQRTEQPERMEQPKEFVNAQGQKTGTIINVTA